MPDLNLSQQDLEWGASMDLHFSSEIRHYKATKEWQFRGKENDLSDLLLRHSRFSLFFYGVAKGNPGLAGAGGIIKNKEGITVAKFAWGLGHSTIMQAEALALLQGLKQAKAFGLSDISIIGDSQSIIKVLVEDSSPVDIRLARVISRTRNLVKSFRTASFLHVLRENNKAADLEANRAVSLPAGCLLADGIENWDPIP